MPKPRRNMLSLVSEMFTFLRLLFLAYLGADYHIFHKLDSLTALLRLCSNSFHPMSNGALGSEELITILTISYSTQPRTHTSDIPAPNFLRKGPPRFGVKHRLRQLHGISLVYRCLPADHVIIKLDSAMLPPHIYQCPGA
ncbi:hypothetical protein ARMGADRAFT_550893 [Armillaria gallica]|uniref:Uncharacterized protein n=1 Tax=Armillaria gallica TaxID=47427 RepID=A0A2H3DBR2_ARMGA|nr:hypothetical protein ARMGADRAFT_550893 [Armillaria gallica]